MLDPATFHNLVSGKTKGIAASVARAFLATVAVPYGMAVKVRNRRYDSGASPNQNASVPVVCIGNITLGGTGKTPLVRWAVEQFQQLGEQPGIISRGYGTEDGKPNDEARELALQLPGVPHVQNKDRVLAASEVAFKHNATVIVMDDGYQHRRLNRDVDVVLLDATSPFGFNHIFPRGLLREPVAGLKRASAIVLTRADLITSEERAEIKSRAMALAPNAIWAEVCYQPVSLVNASGERADLAVPQGKTIGAFCGIGNPSAFKKTLQQLDCSPNAWKAFPDHHEYTQNDIEQLTAWAKEASAEMVLCTQKDLVKLQVDTLGDVPLWAVSIEAKFLSGEMELQKCFGDLLEKHRAK